MEYKYAGRARFAAPTLIRMANDYAAGNPDFIFFSVGNPSVETFPAKELRELADEVLAEDYKSCLPYGENPGYPPLRALVRERLVKLWNWATIFSRNTESTDLPEKAARQSSNTE